MSTEKITERIKALLRKKNGGSPAEIEAAIAKANELAIKYNIDLATVDPNDELFEVGVALLHTSVRFNDECMFAAMILKMHFNVDVLISRQKEGPVNARRHQLQMVGTKVDCEIAKGVYEFLVAQFRQIWNKYKKGHGDYTMGIVSYKDRKAFMTGLRIGVCRKLDEQKAASNNERGLMVIGNKLAQRKKFVEQKMKLEGEEKPEQDTTGRHAAAGYHAGQRINLNKTLPQAEKANHG